MSIAEGDYWQCDESQADSLPDPWQKGYDAAGIAEYARFRVRVDRVDGDYIVLEVTLGNSHPRTPEIGCTIVKSKTKLYGSSRWNRIDKSAYT